MPSGTTQKSIKGFTMVEAIVTGVIATVIATTMIVILNLFNTQANRTTVRARMQMDWDMVATDISEKVRNAHKTLANADEGNLDSVCANEWLATTMKLYYPTGGTPAYSYSHGFRIQDKKLQEDTAGTDTWSDYKLGNRVVSLSPAARFLVSPDRKSVTLQNFVIKSTYKTAVDSLVIHGGTFRCRN
jgi:Tfp pilus assembly protein PilE